MQLPLFEEIREARRLAEESRDARIHLQRVGAALASVEILRSHLRRRPDLEAELPGEDVLDLLVDRWPQLADLRAADLPPSSDLVSRLSVRLQQLRTAEQELRPLADDADHRSHHLSQLQEEQRALLGDPRYQEVVAELSEVGRQRERFVHELGPVRQRLALVEPASRLVTTFAGRLRELEADLRDGEGPDEVRAWRACSLMDGLCTGLAEVLDHLDLEIASPPAPPVPESIDRAEPDEALATLRELSRTMERLQETLAERRDALAAEQSRLQSQHDRLTRKLLDQLG